MRTIRPTWIFMLLAVLPVWADSTPAHAQQQQRGAYDYRNRMDQTPQPGSPAPLGGSSMGGLQNRQEGGYGSTPYIGPSNRGGINNANAFNGSGLSNAFGNQFQPQPQYQTLGAPAPGQPYQIPSYYANYAPGTVITWGRYRYQLGSDGTMTSAGPIAGQPYQIPAQFANQPPGTVVTKGRFRYLLGNDGTMTAYNGPVPPTTGTEATQTSNGPTPGERYQIPAEHANAAPGSVFTYNGHNYVVGKDGTMTALSASQ
ncbi:hypothetical protein V5E97_04510 [Singulisphaera sp. Ch08]|uniref:Uncharacterized protein n=1 Tax=Singulisphaera sp. Ch08 TaxID=3120278 RepID=A0AAU7CJT3_9BACT